MTAEYPIGELKIKPSEESRLLLGSYRKDTSPKGFALLISPDSQSENVTSRVVTVEVKSGLYNLVMYIQNVGSKPIKAEVWPIK